MKKPLALFSWNINGIRAAVRKGFGNFLRNKKPDVIGLQEIKISEAARLTTEFDFPGYTEIWHSAERPGYSGTATLIRDGISHSVLPSLSWDTEGRIQAMDFGDFFFLNVYVPNAGEGLKRLAFKLRWGKDFLVYVKTLERKKPVIIGGDYNVAHEEIDIARPKENVHNPGFTAEERSWMTGFLRKGFVDTFRRAHPDKIQYTWWSQRGGARSRNVGWRIDYLCVSASFLPRTKSPSIHDQILGSDHCPVSLTVL